MGKIKLNEVYKPLYTSNKRYFLITGGRGSLKSTTVHDFICRLTYSPGQGILFTRYTMTSAEKSIIPEFRETLKRNQSESNFHITKDKAINLTTGSFIIFSGIKTSSGNQTANLKSLAGITTWVIEEGEDFNDERAFDTIDDSVRSISTQNRVIWIQNPSTKEHFIYKRWIADHNKKIKVRGYDVTISNHPEVEHIHTTYHIATEYLSKSFLRKANLSEEQNNKWYYHNYIGGWLEKAEGVIFDNWIEGEFDESLPYAYGMDFGVVDPDTLIKVAIDKKRRKIYLKELMYDNGQSSKELFDKLEHLIDNKNDLIVADSAEPRMIGDIRDKGFNIAPAQKGKDSIKNGIKKIQDYQLIVDAESINLKKELNNYCWNDKKAEIPIDQHNHLLDAFRYGFEELDYGGMFFG